mgnify:CR=1 FL=1
MTVYGKQLVRPATEMELNFNGSDAALYIRPPEGRKFEVMANHVIAHLFRLKMWAKTTGER